MINHERFQEGLSVVVSVLAKELLYLELQLTHPPLLGDQSRPTLTAA
jgi:hypothetical protein